MRFARRPVLVFVLAVAAFLVPFLFRVWKTNADRGGQQPAEPFRIAGNFYYVGANDVTSFLITGPEGTSCWTAAIQAPHR